MARKQINGAVAATLPLIVIPAKRGRPCTGQAMTNNERQKAFRKRHKLVDTGEQIGATVKRLADQFDMSEAEVMRELVRFALCNKNWSQTGFPLRVTKKETDE